jgi:hypothetical protein
MILGSGVSPPFLMELIEAADGGRPGSDIELSRSGNDIYAFTKPDGLNLGRQTGIQEAEACELHIEGELTVFRRMWTSKRRLPTMATSLEMRTCRMNGVLLWSNESDHATPGHEHDIEQILDYDLLR